MKKIVFLFAILLLAAQSKSQLMIKNSLSKPIRVAVGWYQQGQSWSGFMTKGWYQLSPGETINPGMNFTSDNDYFLFYVEGIADGVKMKNGTFRMLVNEKSGFNVKNANLDYIEEMNRGVLTWRFFKRRDVRFKLLQERKYTLEIGLNEMFY